MAGGFAALGAAGSGGLDSFNTQYDAATKQLGEMAFGRTLQMLGAGGAPQMGPQMGPQGAPMAGGMPSPGGQPGMPPGGPPMGGPQMQPQGRPPMAPQGGPPPMQPQGGPPMGGAPGGGMPPPGGPPGMPPGGGGMPGGGMPGGQPHLDWRTVAQKVTQANPGLPPNAIAAAVDRFMPLMSQQSLAEWRQVQEQLRYFSMNQKPQIIQMQEAGKDRRLEETEAGKDRRLDESEAGKDRRLQEKPLTATELKLREREKDLGGLITQIDTALKSIDESQHGGEPVTGVGGAISRAYEFAAGALGMTDSTKASDFQTQIRLIQSQLPRLLVGISKISAEERAHLDDVVRGLGRFTNAAQAKSALEYVKSVLQSKMGDGSQPQRGQPQRQQRGGGQQEQKVIRVKTPEEADKLKPGTPYQTPDGRDFIR